jgi:ribonuclease HI
MPLEEVTVYTDGASRGNPGRAAVAFVLRGDGLGPVEYADTIGVTTNNAAEYTAMVRALEFAKSLGSRRVRLFSDSELMVRQMRGEYRVKNADILVLFEEAQGLVEGFDEVRFAHVPRSANAEADALCNRALDGSPVRLPQAVAVDAPAPNANGDGDLVQLLTQVRSAWSAGSGPSPEELAATIRTMLAAPPPTKRGSRRRTAK